MRQLNVLGLDIGRGHPFYLDGTVRNLETYHSNELVIISAEALQMSEGLPKILWKNVARMYRIGSRGGIFSKIYGELRHRRVPNHPGLPERLLSSNIRSYLEENRNPTLVSHPMLVPMISDLVPTYYQHGEIAVPDESIVRGAKKILVPLESCMKSFLRAGINEKTIFVTGLCIEPEIANRAESSYLARVERMKSAPINTGGFFSSGAEPPLHIDKIIRAVQSLHETENRAIIFCRRGGRLEKETGRLRYLVKYDRHDLPEDEKIIFEKGNIVLVSSTSLIEENQLTSRLFRLLDYFVAPSHERTSWAVGLGIPMFILHPVIGPFSPLNRQFLLDNKVADDLDTAVKADKFAGILEQLFGNGTMPEMATNGFGKYRT